MCEKNRLIRRSQPEQYVTNSLTPSFHVWGKRVLLTNKTIGSRYAEALQSRRFGFHDEIANASTRPATMYRSAYARCGNPFKCLDPLNIAIIETSFSLSLDIHTHATFLLSLNTALSWGPFFAARNPPSFIRSSIGSHGSVSQGCVYRDESKSVTSGPDYQDDFTLRPSCRPCPFAKTKNASLPMARMGTWIRCRGVKA